MTLKATRYDFKDMTLPEYRKMKIALLEKEFMVPITQEEKKHINALDNEIAIDRYCRTLLKNFWN